MSEQEIYERFIDWLKLTWWGVPEADEMMPLTKATYTPEEASLLTGIPFSAKDLEELAEMKQMDPEELKQKLDELAKKGVVFRSIRGDSVRYRLNDQFFTFMRASYWAGGTSEREKTTAPLMNQYFYHGFFDQYDTTTYKGLRALPVDGTIEDKRQIMPYEEVDKVLDAFEYYSVTTCPCKHRKNVDPDMPNCEYPTEVCLHFDELGRYCVDSGMGREITREETKEILRQSAEVGLVHSIDPWQEKVTTICNCDPCCCLWFEGYHKLGHAMSVTPSNYQARSDPESCIGCGLCVKRCHMDTIKLEDYPGAKDRVTKVTTEDGKVKELKNKSGKVAVVDLEHCIGCGICVYKCSTKSLTLEHRETTIDPPKDTREYGKLLAADFAAGKASSK